MITTDDSFLASRLKSLRNHGSQKITNRKLEFVEPGFNYRLSEIPAAIGLAQMRRIDQILLDHAAERGCTVLEETEAIGPIEEDGRVCGMRIRDAKGEREIRAALTVDASGTRCVLGRHFGLTRDVPDLQATATWCYVRGAGGVKPPLSRNWSRTRPRP